METAAELKLTSEEAAKLFNENPVNTLEQIINASDDDLTELKKFTRENLPEATCPRIDGLQKSLDSIERTLGRFNRYEDAESLADDVSGRTGANDSMEIRKDKEN